jgi:hypothetical protein
MTITRKIGLNRGVSRLWLEGSVLSSNGFNHGSLFDVEATITDNGKPCLMISLDSKGSRKVAGNPLRPIIDINGAKLLEGFHAGDMVQIDYIKASKSLMVWGI